MTRRAGDGDRRESRTRAPALAFTATVATFTDDNPFGEAGDFTATINWGDGQTSTGSIRVNPLGGFEVTGSHTYASAACSQPP